MRVRGSDIKSYMPAVDPRAHDEVRVLGGRNYLFDSKGPKSGFDCRVLSPFPFGAEDGVESRTDEGLTVVFTAEAAMRWNEGVVTHWDILQLWDDKLTKAQQQDPWYLSYMEGNWYATHYTRGFFRISQHPLTGGFSMVQLTDADIPGLPEDIRGMRVVRNRMILTTDEAIYWTGTGTVDFTPALGGAGFQLTSSFIQGEFIGISDFQAGFVVWTEYGSVLAEFIGGDLTWRWSPTPSAERPIGLRSMATLTNGVSVFLSQRGLKFTQGGNVPQDLTPEFNEYLREYLKDSSADPSKWLLTYDPTREMIFISESLDDLNYWRTLVLAPTIDKWGEFSDAVFGFITLPGGRFGYVGMDGIARYFADVGGREIDPPTERGLNRMYPRVQKNHSPAPSTSFICFAAAPGFENRPSRVPIRAPGWAEPESLVNQPLSLGGMDSCLELGYFRPPELQNAADEGIEIQEILVSTPRSTPWFEPDFTIEGHEEDFYFEYEDWETMPDSYEDWNALADSYEDWNSPYMNYRPWQFGISIESSMDGRTYFDIEYPTLATFAVEARTFSVYTSGLYHRIKFTAIEADEYYTVTLLELTMSYGGQIA